MMNGILPLWKPRGMTSHDCVARIRKIYGTRKVGHTGTLDPEVEGVLAICIGQATKVVPFLTAMKKTYIVECSLGKSTDTEDAYGKTIEETTIDRPLAIETINQTLALFRGEITQIPPMYSAVRVNGKRLYEYARANEEVVRPSRQVTIYELENLTNELEHPPTFRMNVTCSEGTYMRTLCVDIGKKLGYPAHMSDLVRLETSSFSAEETVTFADIENAQERNEHEQLLVPISRGLNNMDRLEVNEDVRRRVLHGQKFPQPEENLNTDPFLVMFNEELLAIYQTHPEDSEQIKPVRVFNG